MKFIPNSNELCLGHNFLTFTVRAMSFKILVLPWFRTKVMAHPYKNFMKSSCSIDTIFKQKPSVTLAFKIQPLSKAMKMVFVKFPQKQL